MIHQSVRDRLIVGLDVLSISNARFIVDRLGKTVHFYKIGYQLLFVEGGINFAKELIFSGKKVFFDMKLLDIDNTISKAVENILNIGGSMLTLHAYPKVMRAAVNVAKGTDLCLLGVTVLTSMDKRDLAEAGYCHRTPASLVLKRAEQALEIGMGGIVASAFEANILRSVIGKRMILVTPGIRTIGNDLGDQKRVMTPFAAMKAGASHLVVARPIIQAADPLKVVNKIFVEIKNGIKERRKLINSSI